MSVLLETSVGDIVVDLFTEKCPKACKNFLKLCQQKHYNNALFVDIQKDFIAKVENPLHPSTSIYEILGEKKYFEDEIDLEQKFNRPGLLGCSNEAPNLNDSRFFITLTDQHLQQLDGKHTLFGIVAEGIEHLDTINEIYVDSQGKPFANLRIKHTLILDDPFEDLNLPEIASPEFALYSDGRLEYEEAEKAKAEEMKNDEEVLKDTKLAENKKRAIVLEMLNDLPDAEIKPPDNVLFVCKLNPATQERDLEVIFSRFGAIRSCEVIRDWKTGASLQYAFIEFETSAACYEAYLNMENVLIDDRRIHVDFSQSVSKLWPKKKRAQPDKNEPHKEKKAPDMTDEVVEFRARQRVNNDYHFVVEGMKHKRRSRSRSAKKHSKKRRHSSSSSSSSQDRKRRRK